MGVQEHRPAADVDPDSCQNAFRSEWHLQSLIFILFILAAKMLAASEGSGSTHGSTHGSTRCVGVAIIPRGSGLE